MSFSKPRFTDKYEYECIRECSKFNYFVLGGKEKLWKDILLENLTNQIQLLVIVIFQSSKVTLI